MMTSSWTSRTSSSVRPICTHIWRRRAGKRFAAILGGQNATRPGLSTSWPNRSRPKTMMNDLEQQERGLAGSARRDEASDVPHRTSAQLSVAAQTLAGLHHSSFVMGPSNLTGSTRLSSASGHLVKEGIGDRNERAFVRVRIRPRPVRCAPHIRLRAVRSPDCCPRIVVAAGHPRSSPDRSDRPAKAHLRYRSAVRRCPSRRLSMRFACPVFPAKATEAWALSVAFYGLRLVMGWTELRSEPDRSGEIPSGFTGEPVTLRV